MELPRPAPPDAAARVAFITAPDRDSGLRLARALVEARAAACVNLVSGVTSVYRWKGAVQEEAEVLLLVKTRVERVDDLERLIARLHPYDVPELVVLSAAHVESKYLAWLLAESAPGADG